MQDSKLKSELISGQACRPYLRIYYEDDEAHDLNNLILNARLVWGVTDNKIPAICIPEILRGQF